jgi:hypothetical protein
MHDRWEYKIVVGSPTSWKDEDGATDYGRLITTEILNRLGQDGWELCALDITVLPESSGGTMILKRRKS